MGLYYYAQLNNEDICIGVSQLPKPLDDIPNCIQIDFLDTSLGGKKYNRETGEWLEVPKTEPEDFGDEVYLNPEHLNDIEQAVFFTAVNIEYLIAMQEGGF